MLMIFLSYFGIYVKSVVPDGKILQNYNNNKNICAKILHIMILHIFRVYCRFLILKAPIFLFSSKFGRSVCLSFSLSLYQFFSLSLCFCLFAVCQFHRPIRPSKSMVNLCGCLFVFLSRV